MVVSCAGGGMVPTQPPNMSAAITKTDMMRRIFSSFRLSLDPELHSCNLSRSLAYKPDLVSELGYSKTPGEEAQAFSPTKTTHALLHRTILSLIAPVRLIS
ncbi:MAG: hypothetical protein ABIE94_00325 [archaeon]